MLFWFILSFVSGIIAYYLGKKKDKREGYYERYITLAPFLTIVVILVIFMFSQMLVDTFANTHKKVVYTQRIVALNDNINSRGDFFLGSGSVNGEMKYYYMIDQNGLYRMQSIDVEDVQLKYSNENKIQAISEEYDNYILTYLYGNPLSHDEYIISIPKGSIKQDFNVDLK